MIQFSVPGQPVPWSRPRHRGKQFFNDAKMRSWQQQCQRIAFQQRGHNYEFFEAPKSVRVMAFFEIPKSWSKKKRLQAISGELQHMSTPDCDNLFKIVADALNGIFYDDDKQIVAASVSKHYSETPRVEIVVDRWQQRKAA